MGRQPDGLEGNGKRHTTPILDINCADNVKRMVAG